MKDASLFIQSSIATSMCNLDSSFVPNASLDKRTEGWTEVWGREKPSSSEDNGTTTNTKDWKNVDEEYEGAIQSLSAPHPEQPYIILTQYRPAWFEQALLRMADIPHVVVNSPYVATQSTGPLPFLREMPDNSGSVEHQHPVLVGRHHPIDSFTSTNNDNNNNSYSTQNVNNGGGKIIHNSILEYLQTRKNANISCLDSSLTDIQKAMGHIHSNMIETKLNPILLALRFGDDDAWHHVHRPQCIRAATNTSHSDDDHRNEHTIRRWFFPVGAWWQAWAERSVVLEQLRLRQGKVSVEQARSDARQCYQTLETQLQQQQPSSSYLLGTLKPTTVDGFLWAHLVEALGDVHLVTVLADFPRLVQYFQHFYETYFETNGGSSSKNSNKNEQSNDIDWKTWNHVENLCNPFQQLPQETSKHFKDQSDFQNALKLMQTLSIHKHDLKELLAMAKESRESEPVKSARGVLNTWHRWRMGGDVYPPKVEEKEEQEQPEHHEKWRKHNKTNDELWISTVVAGTVLALVFSASARKQ